MRLLHSFLVLMLIVSMTVPAYASDTPSDNNDSKVTISVYYYLEGESNYFDVGVYQFNPGDPYMIQTPEKLLYEPNHFAIEGFATADASYIVTYHAIHLELFVLLFIFLSFSFLFFVVGRLALFL